MFYSSTFKPAWWLSNKHLQTMAAKWFRRHEKATTVREVLSTPDQDILELAWTEIPTPKSNKPIIVILHGLEGSVESHYAKGMLNAVRAQGWVGVLMHFRGCGQLANRQAASYHSGDTRDISYLISLLNQRYPKTNKALIGFSLGGNVLSKYLAQQTSQTVKAAVIVCAPFALASCSRRINRGASKIYQKYLVDMLKATALAKINSKQVTHIKKSRIENIVTLWDFDNEYTAPLNGFKDANDYYQQASGKSGLSKIQTPTLIIHAQDDPFLCHQSTISNIQLNQHITFEVSRKGGHVGFISGNNPLKPLYWLEQRVPEFLTTFLKENNSQ